MKSKFLLFTLLVLISNNVILKASSHANIDTLITKITIFSNQDTLELTGIAQSNLYSDIINKKRSKWTDYIIPIILGLFAGLIALYQVKLNNITSAKIEWVEKFRDSLSDYLTNADAAAVGIINVDHMGLLEKEKENKSERYYKYYDSYCSYTDLASRYYVQVKLLLYKKNKEFEELEVLIDDIDKSYSEVKNDTEIKNLRNKIIQCISLSQNILKIEWKKIDKKSKS